MTAAVSRETPAPEREPAIAADLFGDAIGTARSFAAELIRRGEELGLLGPQELSRIWSRHLLNCALVAPLLRPGRVGDVGSGAGLPGLVLAIARPDVQLVLIDPMERRVDWLREESSRLALGNVEVVRGRAEDLGRLRLDQVTARAVAALRTLIPLTAPLVRVGGELLLMKGARVADEVRAAQKQVLAARLRDVRILELGVGRVPETDVTRVFRAVVE